MTRLEISGGAIVVNFISKSQLFFELLLAISLLIEQILLYSGASCLVTSLFFSLISDVANGTDTYLCQVLR